MTLIKAIETNPENPAEMRIRPDVEEIIGQSDEDFQTWHSQRKEATQRVLKDYALFASIPNLAYEKDAYAMDAITAVRNQIDALREGLVFLDALQQFRESYKQTKA